MRWIGVVAVLAAGGAAAQDCTPCDVPGGAYWAYVPEAADGAILFSHGYRGRAERIVGTASLQAMADDLGVALVGLQSAGDDWSLPGAPTDSATVARDEVAYAGAVLDDVISRFGVDPAGVVAAGFSAGGMMTWTLACEMGDRLAGAVPMAGTFWDPIPEGCSAPPVSVVHVHGTTDEIVPMAGRVVGDARQGDLEEVLAMYAAHGGFGAVEDVEAGPLDCSVRTSPAGLELSLCLHGGGHGFTADQLRVGWERVMATR
ncbi:alpha/beta hydrolase family esterase [Pontivivens ytuae]|uniref:Polyhydroxybutyrate depolymerase n=1 Tax=Pontivivens ytuae TaxID=2789856 RepID=A0A7S9LQC0_9RHOB|nr:polyhydroxybutyrate depolymerase [Pontivivens ytuae]QPH53293.1 polyhydroxybutyrate depolymerase [Pontivivens ytuae]